MAANVKIDIAAEFVGKKAFTDAAKQTVGLNSQVKTLAKSYLGLFTVQRLGRAGFNAAKAFAADDKAARVLTQSLDNLGLAFADPSVKSFIADLEKQFGVLDDQLRPAYQRLLTTTGDVAKSQSLLRTALDLSAASGQDVVSVAGDLSKGYVGQTRALAKYGIGLTQAQLKAMSFEEVQTRINTLFGGQATVAVDTYSGALARLSVSANNAKEVIGGMGHPALYSLMDVSIVGITTGQSIKWDGIRWIPYTPTGGGNTSVFGEVPTDSGDQTNFTLANTPVANTTRLYRGGAYQQLNVDYTLSTATITLSTALASGESLLCDYEY